MASTFWTFLLHPPNFPRPDFPPKLVPLPPTFSQRRLSPLPALSVMELLFSESHHLRLLRLPPPLSLLQENQFSSSLTMPILFPFLFRSQSFLQLPTTPPPLSLLLVLAEADRPCFITLDLPPYFSLHVT